jgi:hypothetical protein
VFRGIGLWVIFLDHIPFNVISWITLRNYGFSDAAEMFVFISGYTAGFVYGPPMHERPFAASLRLLKRAHRKSHGNGHRGDRAQTPVGGISGDARVGP